MTPRRAGEQDHLRTEWGRGGDVEEAWRTEVQLLQDKRELEAPTGGKFQEVREWGHAVRKGGAPSCVGIRVWGQRAIWELQRATY